MAEVVILGINAAAGATVVAAGSVAAAAIQIGVGLSLSALGAALAKKAANTNGGSGGIKTQSTTNGDEVPQSFIMGRYITAGNYVCPDMFHGVDGDTRYMTRVIDLGDIPIDALESIIIDGQVCTLATGSPSTLTMTDGDGTTPAIHPTYGPTVETPAKFRGFAWAKFYDGTQTAADPYLLSTYGSYPERPWSSDMILRGVPYVVLTFLLRDSPQLWDSKPDIQFVVRGIKVYDPRLDSTAGGSGPQRHGNRATYAWSENPIVLAYNVKRGIPMDGGRTYAGGFDAEDLPFANWVAAMNACDTMVGSRKRFVAGYEVKIGTPELGGEVPLTVCDELYKACMAEIADVGGTVYVRVGGPAMPVKFITDEDILRSQPQDYDPFPALNDRVNAIFATYPSLAAKGKAKESKPYFDAAAEAEDGQRLVASVAFPAVTNGRQVQALQRGLGKDHRRFGRHNTSLPPDGVLLNPLEVINWTSAQYGYTGKDFEIGQAANDMRTLTTTLAIRERNSGDVGWTAGDETAVDAPSVVPFDPPAMSVAGFGVGPRTIFDAAGNARRAAVVISWTPTVRGIRNVRWRVRLTSSGAIVASGTSPLDDGEVVVKSGILPSTAYQVQVRYVTRKSAVWSAWTGVTTSSLKIRSIDIDEDSIFPSRMAFGDASNLVRDNEVIDEDGWSNLSASTFALQDSTNPNSDSDGRLRWVGPLPVTSVQITTTRKRFRVKPGQVLFCSGQADGNGGTYNVDFTIRFYEKDGTPLSPTFLTFANLTYAVADSVLRTATGSITVPALARKAEFSFRVNSCSSNVAVGGPTVYRKKERNTIESQGVARDNIADNAVTDVFQDTALTAVALTTTFQTILTQTINSVGAGRAFIRAVSVEARAVGAGNTEIQIQSRIDEFGSGYGAWEDTDPLRVVTRTTFGIERFPAVSIGPWVARQWRVQARVTSASGTTAIRNCYLTFMDITK